MKRTHSSRVHTQSSPQTNGSIVPAPTLVGHWQEPGNSDSVEFRADGTLLEHTPAGDGVRGRYTLAGDRLTIQIDGVDPLAFDISLNPKTLELRDGNGQVTRYSRVR